MLIASLLTFATAVTLPSGSGGDAARLILDANRAAMNGSAWHKPALRLHYRYRGQGLLGVVDETDALQSPAYVITRRLDRFVEQEGFDGKSAWARERSGSVSKQSGGDMRALAVSQAYRAANLWWKPDFGGAIVGNLGRRTDQGVSADVLRIVPVGGVSFDAWFDVRTHLLTKIQEVRHGEATVVLFSDYRPYENAMLAASIRIATGDHGQDETETLERAEFLNVIPIECCAMPTWTATDTEIANEADRTVMPFRMENDHIYVDVRVNRRGPFAFLVDTGGANIITPATARAAGTDSAGSLEVHGGGAGAIEGGLASLRSLSIGAATMRDQPVQVLSLSNGAARGIEEAGMIGFETFHRFVTRIDYGRHEIELIRPSAFDPKGAGVPIPIAFYGNLPVVRGSYDGVLGDFTIDTGNPGSVFLNAPFADRNALRAKVKNGLQTIVGVGVGGPSYGLVFRGGPLLLGMSTMVAGPIVSLSSDTAGALADAFLAGNVGAAILKRFVVTLDYAHSLIYLKPIEPSPHALDRYDESGMRISAIVGGFRVSEVLNEGPAALAGVRRGDVIGNVNGRPAESLSLDQMHALLRDQRPGTPVELAIARDGKQTAVTLTLRTLIR